MMRVAVHAGMARADFKESPHVYLMVTWCCEKQIEESVSCIFQPADTQIPQIWELHLLKDNTLKLCISI